MSSQETLTVTGLYPTTTAISSSGLPGNYTLTGTVVGLGSLTSVLKGEVSFFDTSNSNSLLGKALLGKPASAQSFASQVSYGTGGEPDAAAVADLNGDGIPDLAVTNQLSNNVSVLLGNGDGTFQPQVNYSTSARPIGVAVGDFNGDGKLDLAVVNLRGNSVSILLGNGDGTFQPQVTFPAGDFPAGLAVGDFNGDGNLDLAVVNESDNTMSILLGNGDGTFQPQVTYATGGEPEGVVAGDFNGDGKLDLALLGAENRGDLLILLGNGDGTFETGQATPNAPTAADNFIVADLNGDGYPDLLIDDGGPSFLLYLGNANGTFTLRGPGLPCVGFGSNGCGAAVGDLNGDGKLDILFSALTAIGGGEPLDPVSVLLNTTPNQ
jgi:hypothetical protein